MEEKGDSKRWGAFTEGTLPTLRSVSMYETRNSAAAVSTPLCLPLCRFVMEDFVVEFSFFFGHYDGRPVVVDFSLLILFVSSFVVIMMCLTRIYHLRSYCGPLHVIGADHAPGRGQGGPPYTLNT